MVEKYDNIWTPDWEVPATTFYGQSLHPIEEYNELAQRVEILLKKHGGLIEWSVETIDLSIPLRQQAVYEGFFPNQVLLNGKIFVNDYELRVRVVLDKAWLERGPLEIIVNEAHEKAVRAFAEALVHPKQCNGWENVGV